MEEVDLPLLVHGEVTDPGVDIFDREAAFIEQQLQPIVERFPRLRVVLEHITTRDAVDFRQRLWRRSVAATITAHHLLLNRNDMLVGGIKPHYYCLPILKRRQHQEALRAAAVCGTDRSFFIGTDSAPHELARQGECLRLRRRIYSAHAALEFYAEVFDELGRPRPAGGFRGAFWPGFLRTGAEPGHDHPAPRRLAGATDAADGRRQRRTAGCR
jgi:dihydroorotase